MACALNGRGRLSRNNCSYVPSGLPVACPIVAATPPNVPTGFINDDGLSFTIRAPALAWSTAFPASVCLPSPVSYPPFTLFGAPPNWLDIGTKPSLFEELTEEPEFCLLGGPPGRAPRGRSPPGAGGVVVVVGVGVGVGGWRWEVDEAIAVSGGG